MHMPLDLPPFWRRWRLGDGTLLTLASNLGQAAGWDPAASRRICCLRLLKTAARSAKTGALEGYSTVALSGTAMNDDAVRESGTASRNSGGVDRLRRQAAAGTARDVASYAAGARTAVRDARRPVTQPARFSARLKRRPSITGDQSANPSFCRPRQLESRPLVKLVYEDGTATTLARTNEPTWRRTSRH